MPYGRMTERLGVQAWAFQVAATAQASVNVPSGNVATVATSNIIDSWTLGERRIAVRADLLPLTTAGTGNATVALYHGTATGAMSAASVGTGTVAMAATAAVGTAGKSVWLELNGPDLASKNRYLQAIVTPGGGLVAAVHVEMLTENRNLPPTAGNVSQLVAPVVVADL